MIMVNKYNDWEGDSDDDSACSDNKEDDDEKCESHYVIWLD